MTLKENKSIKSHDELAKLIEKGMQKVGCRKENDLCKYLPGPTGGYMHHFTFRKMRQTEPAELAQLLQKFIINADALRPLDPKPRAPRGSRKQRDFVNFTRTDIEKVLELARKVGDDDLVARFSPKRSLPTLKRELLRSIRENRINQELWSAYSETIATLESTHSLLDN